MVTASPFSRVLISEHMEETKPSPLNRNGSVRALGSPATRGKAHRFVVSTMRPGPSSALHSLDLKKIQSLWALKRCSHEVILIQTFITSSHI